jgi:hypothetical protein
MVSSFNPYFTEGEMDPITSAFVAALSLGAAGIAEGITEVGKKAIDDAYTALKSAIRKKFGGDSKVVDAVEALEKEPDFEPNQLSLAGRISQVKAVEDGELITLVAELKSALEGTPEGREAAKKYINIVNSEVGVVGDGATVTGGIHFGGNE